MSLKTLKLQVVSQEKELLTAEVDSLTAPTTSGEITVLPDHMPLFTRIKTGEVVYRIGKEAHSIVVADGFLDVTPDNNIHLMVDSGILAHEISLEKAQAAVKAAHETMSKTLDQRELMLAEASLRRAMLEIQVAQKSKRAKI